MTSALQRPHVLVVTDDPDLGSFLGEGLIYAGFWTSTIASALQVLEVFRLRSFDLIVVDAALGGIGAAELLRRLQEHADGIPASPRTDVPIVVVAATEAEVVPGLRESPAIARVLTAPIEIETVAAEIGEAVQKWRAVHPERPWADDAALGAP